MFGIYRWFLAVLVLVAHSLTNETVYLGHYAVFGFFILSGYLMTLVLHERYYALPRGIGIYVLNRFLRVYPSYIIVLLISAVVVGYDLKTAQSVYFQLKVPENTMEWISNLTTFGIMDMAGGRRTDGPVVQIWSVNVEIIFWMLLPILVKNHERLLAWTLFSVLFLLPLLDKRVGMELRYFSPIGTSFVFCTGAWLYFIHKRRIYLPLPVAILAAAAFLAELIWTKTFFSASSFEGLYVAFLLQSLIVWYLSGVDKLAIPDFLARLDSFLGNISYPLFLTHMLAGVILKLILPETLMPRYGFVFEVFVLSHLLAIPLWYLVDRRVQSLRISLRKPHEYSLRISRF